MINTKIALCYAFTGLFVFLSAHAKLLKVSSEQEFNQLVQSQNSLVVNFCSSAKPVCTLIDKTFKKLADHKKFENISFIIFDVTKEPGKAIAAKYNITTIPTFVYFNDGKIIEKDSGAYAFWLFDKQLSKKLLSLFTKKKSTIKTNEGKKTTEQPQIQTKTENIASPFFDKVKDALKYFGDLIKKIIGK